jgi:hypothetical protein
LLASLVNMSVALGSRWKSTPLRSRMAPVTNVPAGTITWPPPFELAAAIAFLNAAVLSVCPSPTAPNWELVARKVSGLKVGTAVLARMSLAAGQGSGPAAGAAAAIASTVLSRSGDAATPPAASRPASRSWRRVNALVMLSPPIWLRAVAPGPRRRGDPASSSIPYT